MNRFLLYLLMLPSGLYRRAGTDLAQLRAILHVRLLMDDRRPLYWNQRGSNESSKKKRPVRFASIRASFFSFCTGAVYLFPLLTLDNDALAISLYFTFFLTLLTFSLVSDFSTVLLDARDKYIILPRPVSGRTLFMARLVHISIYLFRVVLPMSLPGWIALPLMTNWKAALWFPLPLLLITATALFFVMGLYLLMLRLAKPGRFQEWLNGFQIALSILILASFYIAPQILREESVRTALVTDVPWIQALPSYWVAATFSWILPAAFPGTAIWYSIAAILFPIVCLWVTVRFLAPKFSAKLAELDTSESPAEAIPASSASPGKTGRRSFVQRLSILLNAQPSAQAGFLLSWLQTGRSRTFRMRVLPSLAYVPMYFVYTLTMSSNKSLHEAWADLGNTHRYLLLLYISSFALLQSLNYVMLSDQHKAAWVYHAAPLQQPGLVMAGALKAVWIKYFLPFFLAIAIFILTIWGLEKWLDILLSLVNVSLFVVSAAYVSYRTFPFSRMEQMHQKSGRVFRTLLTMLIPSILGFAHYTVSRLNVWWLTVLFLSLSSILLWMIWDSYRKTDWATIIRGNNASMAE